MDKLKTKRVVVGAGLTAALHGLSSSDDLERALLEVGLRSWSSPPLRLERRYQQGEDARNCRRPMRKLAPSIHSCSQNASWRSGAHRGVLGRSALPSIRIQPATEFYDYQAKYFRNDTQYHCPSGSMRARRRKFRPRRSRRFA